MSPLRIENDTLPRNVLLEKNLAKGKSEIQITSKTERVSSTHIKNTTSQKKSGEG
jgi:hypothetical protein